jgi:5,10-methenyltetrahydromethanopterin hydrogenase
MLRFLKPNVVGEKTGKQLISIELSKPENQLNDQLIEIGSTTRRQAFKKLKPGKQKGPIMDMRKLYQAATNYFTSHHPIGTGIVKDLSCSNLLL